MLTEKKGVKTSCDEKNISSIVCLQKYSFLYTHLGMLSTSFLQISATCSWLFVFLTQMLRSAFMRLRGYSNVRLALQRHLAQFTLYHCPDGLDGTHISGTNGPLHRLHISAVEKVADASLWPLKKGMGHCLVSQQLLAFIPLCSLR